MNIRRVFFFAFLVFFSPLPFHAQSSSSWGRPTGVRSADLFSTGELKTVILMFLAAVLLLSLVFLLSVLLSAWGVSHVPGAYVFRRKEDRAPDLHAGNQTRTAVVRRLHASSALLAARNEAEKKEEGPSRFEEEPGRG